MQAKDRTIKDDDMTDYSIDDSPHRQQQRQIIRCPNCKASITVEELHEYVNTKPESKREAIAILTNTDLVQNSCSSIPVLLPFAH
jgi:hypothetical protein